MGEQGERNGPRFPRSRFGVVPIMVGAYRGTSNAPTSHIALCAAQLQRSLRTARAAMPGTNQSGALLSRIGAAERSVLRVTP